MTENEQLQLEAAKAERKAKNILADAAALDYETAKMLNEVAKIELASARQRFAATEQAISRSRGDA